MKAALIVFLALLTWMSWASGREGGPVTTEEIRERIAAINIRSIQSAMGHLVVSGPDSLGNSQLLSMAEKTAVAMQSLTGQPLPFERQSVRILVLPETASPPVAAVMVEHVRQPGVWIHRVVLESYEAAETEAAAEALCGVLLSVYVVAMDSGTTDVALPKWLWRGIARVLTDSGRSETIDAALRLWREGRLPPPAMVLAETEPTEEMLTAYGVFVIWISSFPERAVRFSDLFKRLSAGDSADRDWLRECIPGDGDPDELWDRWLLSQRGIVRVVGAVTMDHLDALYAEWLIHSGRAGIPRDAELPGRADCTALAAYRGQPWFTTAVREKRSRIEVLAAGRPPRFQVVVAAYVKSLSAIEKGASAATVGALAREARREWLALREAVEQAGGVWTEP